MIRPSPTDLLTGVAEVLRESVSAELPAGDARNQVRAAAAVLRRLAAVWDRVVPALQEENRDIDETLSALSKPLAALGRDFSEGVPSVDLAATRFEAVAERNRALQQQLVAIHDALAEVDDSALKKSIEQPLRALHQRNLARDRELSRR